MGKWEETERAYGIDRPEAAGKEERSCSMPLPEFCEVCTLGLRISPGCFYCMLNDKYI